MDKTGSLSPISISSTCSQHVQLQKMSMAPTTSDQKILRKTGISKKQKNTHTKKKKKKKKKRFLPQNQSFSQYRKNSLSNENNTPSHTKSCKLNLHSSKRHTDMARKRYQPFKRQKMPRKFLIDNEGSVEGTYNKMCVS